jgi:hypothetical protein
MLIIDTIHQDVANRLDALGLEHTPTNRLNILTKMYWQTMGCVIFTPEYKGALAIELTRVDGIMQTYAN